MRKLLSDRAAVRISENRATFYAGVRQHRVEIGGERCDVIGPGQLAALSVTAQVRDDHEKTALQPSDQRVEHHAADHEAVEQKQRLANADEPVENTVRRTIFSW